MEMTADALVPQIVDVLKAKVSEFRYNQWLKPARFSLGEDALAIEVPNKFIRDWITDHYLPLIEYEVSRLCKRSLRIAITVNERVQVETPAFSALVKDQVATVVSKLPKPASFRESRPARVPARPVGLNSKYTFTSFVVGSGNEFCHAAALAVSENPGRTYNPFFIYGGVGLGKTHLLNAIGLRLAAEQPHVRVLCVTGEQFTNELINAIRYETTYEFRKKYRESCDILLIDDVQFIAGKERTQEEFFHTFNTLYESRRQIVLTSDRPPKDITQLEDRLRSRFNWGIIADMQVPDTETRVAILRKRAEAANVVLPDNVAYLMADRIRTNIRDLEGAFTRLSAFAYLYKCELSTELAQKILQDMVAEHRALVSFERIQDLVADHFKINVGDLKSAKRYKTVSEPRHVAMYLCKKFLKTSFPEIGHQFGGKDHSTVIHAVRKIEKEIEINPTLQASIFQLEKNLSV